MDEMTKCGKFGTKKINCRPGFDTQKRYHSNRVKNCARE